jgi:hypothetical protein
LVFRFGAAAQAVQLGAAVRLAALGFVAVGDLFGVEVAHGSNSGA